MTAEELAAIAARLRAGSDPHSYSLLYVLGKMGAVQYRGLVESLMRQNADLELARLALQILATWWAGNSQYMFEVARFARGVDWDLDDDLRLMAISALGEYLRDASDFRLLEQLYKIYLDHSSGRLIRETAFRALARAIGRSWQALPPASRLDISDRDEAELLVIIERRLASEMAEPK